MLVRHVAAAWLVVVGSPLAGAQAPARVLTKPEAEVKTTTSPYLDDGEIAALMARRDLIVARFDTLVADQGEAQVLY